MKKMKYIVFLLIGILLNTACNDLDQAPIDSYTDANYWTSTTKAQNVLNMAYRQMYSADNMWNDEALSDNMLEARGAADQRVIRNGQANPSTGIFGSTWADLYGGIKTCHLFLENVDRIPNMDPAVKARMVDEIRFIRAAIFFRLTNFYGDIPFFTKDITLLESKVVSRSPRAEVLKFIHEELDAVIANKNLPISDNIKADERGRITLGTAVAFQARAYLYESDWENVVKYCDYLISKKNVYGSYSLFRTALNENHYLNLFTVANEYNSEVIFDCNYAAPQRIWSNMGSMGPVSLTKAICARVPLQSLVDSYLKLDGTAPVGNERNIFTNRDPRLYATVVYDGYEWVKADGTKVTIRTKKGSETNDSWSGLSSDQSASGYYVRKYYDLTMGSNNQSGLNIITYRYADILLMYAEARNEIAKLTQSEWDLTIKDIRDRAGFKSSGALNYPTAKTQGELREIIRNERRVEFAFEGLRYYDIKRWKAGQKYLVGFTYGAVVDDSNQNVKLDEFRFNESRDYLWSVPLSQMDLNPNLRPNNPGYGS